MPKLILSILVAVPLLACSGFAVAQFTARPNIVFIITDDQRADWLGSAGHPDLKTPNIDRLANEGARFTKRLAYDESIGVPFVVRYPALIQPGTIVDALAANVDVAPTLLDLTGVEAVAPVHGRSLLPLFRDPSADWRDEILTEYFLEKVVPNARPWQSVRTNRWKHIRYTDLDGMDELYDLDSDPVEINNVILDPSARPVLLEMQVKLDSLLAATR